MEDQASLSLRVDASSVKGANDALDSLKNKAGQAGDAVDKLADQAKAAGDSVKPLSDALGDAAGKAEDTGKALDRHQTRFGELDISANQYANSMRNMSAQMTDIVTQLQGGQDPLTILIQQGGQISDSFGGLENTFKLIGDAMNTANLSFGAAIGAIALLVTSGYAASHMFDEMTRSVIQMGGAGFENVGKMEETANQVANVTNVSAATARNLLVQLNDMGQFTAAQMKVAAEAAATFGRAFGDSTDVMKGFSDIAKDPIKGLADLNEQYGFIDAAQLRHIEQIRKEKGETQAAAAAIELYASAMNERSEEALKNMDRVGRLWETIKLYASQFFETFGEYVRAMADQFLAGIDAIVDSFLFLYHKGQEYGAKLAGALVGPLASAVEYLPGMDDTAKKMREAIQIHEQTAEHFRQLSLKDQQSYNKNMEDLGKTIDQTVAANRKRLDSINGGGKGTSTQSRKDVSDAADEIAKANRANEKKQKEFQDTYGARMILQLQEQGESLKAQQYLYDNQLVTGQRITAERKNYLDIVARIATIEAKSARGEQLTKDQESLLANKATIEALAKQNAERGEAVESSEKELKITREIAKLTEQGAKAREQALRTLGLSTREAERQQAIAKIQGNTELTKRQQTAMVLEVNKNYDAITERSDKYLEGFSRGIRNQAEEMGDVYTQMSKFGGDLVGGLSDQFANFFLTGKMGIKDFAKTMIAELTKIATNKAIASMFSAIGGTTWGASIGALFSGAQANAKGGVYSSPSLSAYSGQIVNHPTYFAFAKGAGLMGEAGPEAILPLKRGADGSLGVRAAGMGGGAVAVSVEVNIQNGTATSQATGDNRMAQAFGEQIAAAVKLEIVKAKKPGGILAA